MSASRVTMLRRLAYAAGMAVVLCHALLIAFAPTQLLLLANHDHLTLGLITPAQWEAHLQYHLQQARDYLAGANAPVESRTAGAAGGQMVSLPWCDLAVETTYMLATAMLPHDCARASLVRVAGDPIQHPAALDHSPQQNVPHLPPRNRA